MANILFKKSFLLKNLKEISFDDLWNKKGIFTTIRVIGKTRKLFLQDEHLNNLNRSLKKISVNVVVNRDFINNIIDKFFYNNIYYDHLLRIAVNNKIISVSLRKRLPSKKNFQGILVSYKRPNFKLKNLKYNKILFFLDQINTQSEEIILSKNNLILEGCTTNILCVQNNTVYMPKSGYYLGVTLKFLLKKSKRKIIKYNIKKNCLHKYDEILLIGSGKGIVAVEKIPQINWHKRKNNIFNEFHKIYKSYINKHIVT